MIALFTSNGCPTCRKVIRDIPPDWASQILVLRVEFNERERCYKVYDGDKELPGKAPVESVPTLCFFKTKEVYSGYQQIIERLVDGKRANRT